MRQTKQNTLILDIINNSYNHPTAYDIYLICKNEMPNISLGTVYRNLNNPTSDTHEFYPKPEDAQYSAIQRRSIYDFDYKFEQIRSLNLDSLSKEQLEAVRNYLEFIKNEHIINERTR